MRPLYRNLLTGAEVFSFRRVDVADFTVSFDQVLLLLAVNLLLAFGFDWLRAEPDTEFAFYGFFGWAYLLLGGFWTCALVARLQGAAANTRTLLVGWLSVAPFVLATVWVIAALADEHPVLAGGLLLAVLVAMGVRTTRVMLGPMRWSAIVLIAASAIVLPGFLRYLELDPSLWIVPQEPQEAAESLDLKEGESILFDERERISAAVDATAPGLPGVTDVYFVGFAGYGGQRVFRRESLLAEKRFAGRFGTAERSIQLINDERDRDTYPLATVSGLSSALQMLGDRMDRDDDVLVMWLTSHGSEEEGLAIENGNLPLAPALTPSDLRDALDEAGIQWRVIIVSACYSGAFTNALKSPTTLIITASDAEHASFGCTDDRDLTYFGEAFLRDALPSAPSLEAAFVKARSIIDEREDAEHLKHSNPQIDLGSAIRKKLETLGTPGPGR
jgi:peptidase C13-like protein